MLNGKILFSHGTITPWDIPAWGNDIWIGNKYFFFLKQFNNQTVNGDQGMDDMLKCL